MFVAREVLVETGGVGVYTPGRDNLKAAEQESNSDCSVRGYRTNR